jgi:Secretion system C-terminal sorting domain
VAYNYTFSNKITFFAFCFTKTRLSAFFVLKPAIFQFIFKHMKKNVLLTLVLCMLISAQVQSQTCVRDSSLLAVDTLFISPRPYTAANPVYGLGTACIDKAYSKSVTIKVPPTFVFQGITLNITNASIATTGAVLNLPTGLTYLCDPPNCVFNANTLGCILLYGTPTNAAQAPDTLDLKIKATITSAFGPLNIDFPGPIAPGNYYLPIYPAANCISDADDLQGQLSQIRNIPNPFTGQTTIEIVSAVQGEFSFEVFDIVGKRLHQQTIKVIEGNNQFTFDAGDMANGVYFYSVGNATGKVVRKMIVQQ